MKSFYNRLNVILTVFFILGILLSAFNLYNLPYNLEKISGKIDLSVVKELSPVLNQTNFIIGLTLLLGLGAIIFSLYLLNYTKSSEKIVYIEKKDDKKLEEENEIERIRIQNLSTQVKEIHKGLNAIKDEKSKYKKILSNLCMTLEASQGILYQVQKVKNKRFLELYASFAYNLPESETLKYEFGEGLAGQVAKEKKKLNIQDVPEGYITIISGLGASSPNHLAIIPIIGNNEVLYVVELASFNKISEPEEELIVEALKIGEKKSAKKAVTVKKSEVKSDDKSK